jgi:hypothetical protein
MANKPLNPDVIAAADKLLLETTLAKLGRAATDFLKLVHKPGGPALLFRLGYGIYLMADPTVSEMQAQLESRNQAPLDGRV